MCFVSLGLIINRTPDIGHRVIESTDMFSTFGLFQHVVCHVSCTRIHACSIVSRTRTFCIRFTEFYVKFVSFYCHKLEALGVSLLRYNLFIAHRHDFAIFTFKLENDMLLLCIDVAVVTSF